MLYENFLKLITTIPDHSEQAEQCPVTKTLTVLQGKWKASILFFICKKDTCRFGELHKAFPQISKTMLSSTLKQLELDNLITRRQFNEIPPRTEYTLTEQGAALMPIFYEMFQWGQKYLGTQTMDL